MKKAFLLILAVFAPFLAAAETGNSTESLIVKQAAAWDAAICRKDKPAILANIGENFRQVDGSGTLYTREQFVEDLLDPDLTINPYTVEKQEVRVQGETALVTAETHMTGTYKGKPFSSHYRYVDVYQLKNGRWAVVYIQITKIVP